MQLRRGGRGRGMVQLGGGGGLSWGLGWGLGCGWGWGLGWGRGGEPVSVGGEEGCGAGAGGRGCAGRLKVGGGCLRPEAFGSFAVVLRWIRTRARVCGRQGRPNGPHATNLRKCVIDR